MALLPSKGFYRHWLPGLGVAVAGLLLSLGLALQQADAIHAVSNARFTQETRLFADALTQRIATHTEIVHGLRGLFSANPQLTRAEFDRVASELDISERYPGVRNLSFTRRVTAAEKADYEARVRADKSMTRILSGQISLADFGDARDAP